MGSAVTVFAAIPPNDFAVFTKLGLLTGAVAGHSTNARSRAGAVVDALPSLTDVACDLASSGAANGFELAAAVAASSVPAPAPGTIVIVGVLPKFAFHRL